MTATPARRAACLISLCLLLATSAWAQTPPAKPAAPAKPPAKAATKAAQKAPPPAAKLPVAEGEQLAAAAMAHYGDYDCEFGQKVHVGLNAKNDGYLDIQFGKALWTMKPILSSTGALRLEDVKGRMLMLQIANKSMLMDTKIGQRVVDGCIHEKQRNLAARPAGEGLGIEPQKADAAASAASAPEPDQPKRRPL